MIYNPDRWTIVKFSPPSPEETFYRCFAGWYGSYTGGSSWRLNSGITKVIDRGEYYQIFGYSKTTYNCYKGSEGLSGYMTGVYSSFVSDLENTQTTIEIISADSEEFKSLIKEN